MAHWIDAGPLADLPPGQRRCVQIENQPLVLFNHEGRIHAVHNICPHAGLPLGDGELRGSVLTCPFHGYSYNIVNGRNIDFPDQEPPVRTFHARVEDDRIQIDLDPGP